MLSKLSLIFYSKFLRENLHKINNTDLQVIRTTSVLPEKNIIYRLVVVFFFHSLN